MAVYICSVCETRYNEEKDGKPWEELPESWICAVCDSGKTYWHKEDVSSTGAQVNIGSQEDIGSIDIPDKTFDEFEEYMADIHRMADTGQSIIEPMRTKKQTFSWDEILIKGAQLAKIPLNHDQPVNSRTIIGPRAAEPLSIESPVFISHMSFGALSMEAKVALAKGSAAVKTAMCSGEGGILPQAFKEAHRYIFEYIPNEYSVTKENLSRVDAIEIKFGQSAKPGMGGHLPGDKVTKEIAEIRGFAEGTEIISPAHFKDILDEEDLKSKVDYLREMSGGKPIGIKFAAGDIEADMEIALYAGPDFITIDGRAGATGAAPKYVKAATSIPTIFAIYRARRFLDQNGASDVSLIATGGLRIASDFVKALALGATAVAIGTSALIAIGCRQYRICNTGKCPAGITTHDPELRKRLDVNSAARRLSNFLSVTNEEIKDFARLTGNHDVHGITIKDLCTTNSEVSNHTEIEHV